jgi:hypothetical protein
MPAGKRIALSPDSPLVRSSSRHSIHEAGIGVLIEKFGGLLDATEKGDNRYGAVRYLGLVKRPELEAPCEAAEQEIRPGSEALLPRGGRRLWLFDTVSKLPVLMTTRDETGHEVEYYCYDRFQYPVRLDNDDFNPDSSGIKASRARPSRILIDPRECKPLPHWQITLNSLAGAGGPSTRVRIESPDQLRTCVANRLRGICGI